MCIDMIDLCLSCQEAWYHIGHFWHIPGHLYVYKNCSNRNSLFLGSCDIFIKVKFLNAFVIQERMGRTGEREKTVLKYQEQN